MSAILLAFSAIAIAMVIRWEVQTEKTSRDDSFAGLFALKKSKKADE